MNKSDGSIVIDTRLDNSGFEAGSKRTMSAIQSFIKKVNGLKDTFSFGRVLDKSFQGMAASAETARANLDSVSNEAREGLGSIDDYINAVEKFAETCASFDEATSIEEAERVISDLTDQVERFGNTEFDIDGMRISGSVTPQFQQMAEAVQILQRQLQIAVHGPEWVAFQDRWQGMTTMSGMIKSAFTNTFQAISSSVKTAGAAIATSFRHPLQTVDRALGATSQAAKKVAVNLAKMATGAIRSGLQKIADKIKNIGRSTKQAGSSLSMSLKQLLLFSAGFQTLQSILQKIPSILKTAYEELSKSDAAFGQTVNNFKSALETLKYSFAAAFAPIVETVLPILTSLINGLSTAISKIGQLVAALTGRSTYKKAIVNQANLAANTNSASDAIKDESEAAEEAQKTLAGFDDVEILHDNKQDSKQDSNQAQSSSNEPEVGWEELPIENQFKSLANKLRNYLKDILDVFKQAWAQEGEKVLASMRNALNAVKTLLGDIAQTFYRVFTDGYGFDWLESIFQLLETVFDIIAAIATEFDRAWNDNGRGYKYLASLFTLFTTINNIIRDIGQAFLTAWNDGGGYALCASFLDMFTNINNLLVTVGESFRKAWNSGIGVEICSNILSIMTAINNIVGGLAASFQRGWEEAGNGERVWTAILEIINIVLEAINRAATATAEWAVGLNFSPLIEAFGTVLEAIKPVVEIITSGLAWAWENILLPLGKWTIEEALPVMLETLASAFNVLSAALEALSPILSYLWDNIIKPFGETVGSLVVEALGFLTEKLNLLADWISKNQEDFRSIVEVIGSFVISWLAASAVGGIIGAITAAAELLAGALAALVTGFNPVVLIIGAVIAIGVLLYKNWDTIKEKAGELWEAISGFFGKIGDAIGTAFNAAVELGSNIVEGIKEGITSFFSDPLGWIKENIVGKFIDAVKSLFGIASPSTVMAELGGYIIEGLLNGILDFFNDPLGWVDEHIFRPFMDAIKSLFGLDGEESVLVNVGKNLLEGLKDGLLGAMDGVGDWIDTNITGPICGFFKSLFGIASPSTVFSEYGGYLLEGLKNGLLAAMDGIGDWIGTNVTGPICGFFKDLFGIASPSTVFNEYGGYLMEGLEGGIDENKELPKTALTNAQTSMQNVFSAAKQLTAWAKVGSNMMTIGLKAGILLKTPTVLASVTKLEDDMRKVITKQFNTWKTDAGNLLESFKQGLVGKQSTLVSTINTIITALQTKIDSFNNPLNTSGRNLMTELQNGMNSMSSSISSSASSIASSIQTSFSNQNWYNLGYNIGMGIYNGLVATGNWLSVLAWNTAVDMYNSACRALGIASPSKEFAWIGEMVTRGLGSGIEATQDNAVDAVTSLADAVTQEAEGTNPIMQIDTAVSGIDGVLSTFSDKVVRSFDAMISAMEDIVNGSSLTMPAMANGSVMPYSARRASSQDEEDKLSSLIETLSQRDADRLTRDDLMEVLVNVCRQYLNIDFYIGDEQIARHANAGNAKLNRRYSTT